MAQTVSVSQKELQRVAELAYEGETLKVMLCNNTASLTAQSSVASWQGTEISGNGYVRASGLIGVGSYDTLAGYYTLPEFFAEFSATGAGYTYNTVVIYINGAPYPHSIIQESPNIVLSAGQQQTYSITLISDD